MPASRRKLLLLVIGLVVLGVLVYKAKSLLPNIADFSGAKLWHATLGANPYYLLASIAGIYGCYALRAWRWQRLQTHVGSARFLSIYAMSLAGFSALFFLGRAGEPIRPILISRKDKIPLADTFGIYAMERILDACCTAVLASIALLIFESPGHAGAHGSSAAFEKAARSAGTIFSLIAVFSIGALIYLRVHGSAALERRAAGWRAQKNWKAKLAGIVLGFIRGIQTIRTWSDVVYSVVLSAVHWWLVVLVYFLILRSFSGKMGTLSFSDAMLVLVFTVVGSVVQLPGVGGGAQALSIFALTRLYGVEQEPAVAAAIVLWLITFAICSVAGVPILIHQGFSLGKLKEMAEEEEEATK